MFSDEEAAQCRAVQIIRSLRLRHSTRTGEFPWQDRPQPRYWSHSQGQVITLTRHDWPDAGISGPSFRTQPRRASVSHGHSASRLRRHQFHAVAVPGEHGIVGQQKQGLRLRLGHEHPIERVCMHRRQFGDGRGMLACDWHQLASSPGPHATHRVENGCGSASDRTIL